MKRGNACDVERVTVKVKRLDHARDLPLPSLASAGASGLDLRAAVAGDTTLGPGEIRLIPTGLAISLPTGYEMQIRPRSGLALRHGIGMVNAPGTVDSDYRGEIGVLLINWGKTVFTIRRGDRIAQMVLSRVCRPELEMVDHLEETPRGEGGFGHSGIL